jgi:penicillin-binding protein 1A
MLILGVITAGAVYLFLAPKLPDTNELKKTQLQIPLRILSSEGKLLAEFGEKRRIPADFKEIPPLLADAFLAAEDDRFYEHPGVDYQGLLRAAFAVATTGQKSQGGSTITMQVARNFFLSNKKTYLRKLNEIILALEIEHQLSKAEILTLYLNKIYLGNRAYGVGAAANVYYGKTLAELSLPEMAMIAGLPKAPSKYNPIANPERAKIRRNYVLRRMMEVGFITEDDYTTAIEAPITASYHGRDIEVYAPYVAEMVRTQLLQDYGEEAYTRGFNVYTTIRAEHQQAANLALHKALLDYDYRHGYRGAVDHLSLPADISAETLEQLISNRDEIGPLVPAIVVQLDGDTATLYAKARGMIQLSLDSIKWARPQINHLYRGKAPQSLDDVFKVGDVVRVMQKKGRWQLAQLPEVEGAIIALAPFDGAVTALKGGFEFFQNKFNRVTQSRRQPGSGFKPFIYSAALEKGYTAASIINDAPVVFDAPGLENEWRPENYSGKFFGPTRLRVGLIHSRNLVSIRLLRDIGARYAIDYATRFGFDPKQLPNNLSLALGSGSASPWDMARAYASFANGGYRIEPYLIQRIEDAKGNIIMQSQPATVCETCVIADSDESNNNDGFKAAKRIITPQNAYIMNSMLRDVVKHGTGRKALALGRNDLAGKTGTTNDQVDAWFNGFQPELVAVAWVGFDKPTSLGRYETGGRAALPMWIDFMREALKEVPEEPLKQPVDMVTVKIDPKTGLLARPESDDAVYETFRKQYVPKQMSPSASELNADSDPSADSVPVTDLF